MLIDILFWVYIVGLVIYTLLHLLCGSFGGVATFTVKRSGRKIFVPSMYPAAAMCLLWFITLPLQIHQYQMERVRFYRARAKRRELEGAATGGAWLKIGNEAEGL